MSVQATTWVWEKSKAAESTLLVALAIADGANAQGSESCQSVRTLGKMARCSESTVHRALRWLIDNGEIECIGQNPRYRNTNIYRFRPMWNPAWDAATGTTRGVTHDTSQNDRGVTGDTEGVSSEPERGVTGGTQPQRTPQEDNPTSPGGDGAGGDTAVSVATESLESEFAEWWAAWPSGRKVARKDAFKAYVKARTEASADTILDGLVAHLPIWESMIEAGTKSKVPHPATWLNGGRWEDRPTPDPADEKGGGEPELDPAEWMRRRAE